MKRGEGIEPVGCQDRSDGVILCVYNTPCFNLLSVFCMKTVKPKSQLFGQEQPFLAGN